MPLQPDNDPYAEHDFGAIKLNGNTFFWKFDYYDLDLQMHSPDPSDPSSYSPCADGDAGGRVLSDKQKLAQPSSPCHLFWMIEFRVNCPMIML